MAQEQREKSIKQKANPETGPRIYMHLVNNKDSISNQQWHTK